MADALDDEFADSPLAVAAAAVGAPLSELARLVMRHRPALDFAVPGWLADAVTCVGGRWDVPSPVAAAWLLAEGAARLLVAEQCDSVDWRAEVVPRLSLLNPAGEDDARPLQVPTDGPELHNALGVLAANTGGDPDDIARAALAMGVVRLHEQQLDDDHTCANGCSPDVPDIPLNAHEAAAVAGAPLEPLALALLSPRQFIAVTLPAWVDSWLTCVARRWNTTVDNTASWLLAEGVGYLWAHDQAGDTAWRDGPNRWILPTHGGRYGPERIVEMPGEALQQLLPRLARLRGDTNPGMAALALATGAECWQTDHGCCCGRRCKPAPAT